MHRSSVEATRAAIATAPFGASVVAGGTRFRIPSSAPEVAVVLLRAGASPEARRLRPTEPGLHESTFADVGPGDRYLLRIGDRDLPDPFARSLPDGPHGPAEVLAPLRPRAPRRPIPLARPRSLYELHVGTFTPEGTLDAARAKLPHLAALGVDAIELMPLAAFAGERGWGYDGVAWLAPHPSYGRPESVVAFVDEAHRLGLSVILDVVLNHFGPSGNYLGALDPTLFDASIETPWGPAPRFSHPTLRALARQALVQWVLEHGFDGLRLDATHAIAIPGEPHLLAELAAIAETLPGPPVLIAEDDRNDPRLLDDLGLDGIWADDFHHAVHVLLTRERDGYYGDFAPSIETLADCVRRGWYYEGQRAPTRDEPRGAPFGQRERARLVYCLENHDQVGNRAMGERFGQLVDPRDARAATLLLAAVPASVLLFQGQEWAASTPFLYFTDHDRELGERISHGRREEFAGFAAFADPDARRRIPDPQDPATRDRSVLRWDELARPPHAEALAWTRRVLALRRDDPVLASGDASCEVATERGEVLIVRRALGGRERVFVWNLGAAPIPRPPGEVLLGAASDEIAPRDAVLVARG